MAKTVQLFITCIMDTLYPQVGLNVVDVLRRAGVKVEFPSEQTCCGQPAFNAGMRHLARPLAEHTIQLFEATAGKVVLPSGSCAAMVRHGYSELFAGDTHWLSRAKTLADRTYELSEFLVDYLGITDLGARFPGKIAYHPSCHLARDLGVNHQPGALLAEVREVELVELPDADDCCGFGGVFSVEHPEISTAMLERKLANIETSGAEAVVACDAGCITHINGGLHRSGKPPIATHIAEILARK